MSCSFLAHGAHQAHLDRSRPNGSQPGLVLYTLVARRREALEEKCRRWPPQSMHSVITVALERSWGRGVAVPADNTMDEAYFDKVENQVHHRA